MDELPEGDWTLVQWKLVPASTISAVGLDVCFIFFSAKPTSKVLHGLSALVAKHRVRGKRGTSVRTSPMWRAPNGLLLKKRSQQAKVPWKLNRPSWSMCSLQYC